MNKLILKPHFITLLLFLCFGIAGKCFSEDAVSFGYGLGAWNGTGTGHTENKKYYDYAVFSYIHEKPFNSVVALGLEPFLGVVNRPDNGLELGAKLYIKAYLPKLAAGKRLYIVAGTGAAYTSIHFKEQGTHGLFILQGGIGYRQRDIFIEMLFHHYSNGGLANPNRSVNSNLIKVGYYY